MATINLTNVVSSTRPTGGTAVQFDKPVGSNLTAEQARTLLTSIRAQITAGGTVQTGYLSLQRADKGEFTIENRSRFNAFGDKDGAAALVKDLIRVAYGDAIGTDHSKALETAIDDYLADKSFGKKLGTVSFVQLVNELEINTGGTAEAAKKSSAQALLGAGGSLAVDATAIAKGATEIRAVHDRVDALQKATQGLMSQNIADSIPAALAQCTAHDDRAAQITRDFPGNQTLQARAGQLKSEQAALAAKLNTDIQGRVDTIRPPGQEGRVGALGGAGAVAALQDQVQGLQNLRSQLPQGPDSPILAATRSKVDTALSQAQGELAARQASNATQAELREQGPVKAFATWVAKLEASTTALLQVDTYTARQVATAIAQFEAQTALRQDMTRYNDGLNNTGLSQSMAVLGTAQEALRTKLNDEISKLLQAMQPGPMPGVRASHAVAVMQRHKAALEALQAQLPPEPPQGQSGPINPETRSAVRQALTQATSALDNLTRNLTLQAESLAARSQSAIDDAQQYLTQGGGLKALTAPEIPGAVAVLRALDGLLGAADSATGPHREALQGKRSDLAKAITAAVEPYVDPSSTAALQLKVQQIAGLGLAEATALLKISFAPILKTFVTDVGQALMASASQTPGRVNAGVGALPAAVANGGLGGLVAAMSDGVDKAKAVADLAVKVKSAITDGHFTEAMTAMDALVAAADPSLHDDLRMITAQLMGSLREAVDSVPGKLSQEAQTKLLVGAYDAVAAMARALPVEGPEDITALRGQITTARQQAFTNASAGVIEAARDKELAVASETPDLGRKAAALTGILARAVVLTGEGGPAAVSGNAYATRVRGLAVAALDAQRSALETTLSAAGSAAPARGGQSAERAAVTADLRSFIRNLDALDSAAPGQDVTAIRATVAQLQFMDVRNQLGPKAREAVDTLLSGPAPADGVPHPMQAALLQLYEARVLTLPSFTDRLEFLAGRPDTARLIEDLANGDATVINGFFSGPEWDATALRMKLLAVTSPQTARPGATTEGVQLEHSLLVAKRSLDFALRVGNPTWRAEERTQQLRTNPLGPSAGGMLNIKFDKRSVDAFLAAGQDLNQGAAREAGRAGQPLNLDAFKLALARVVHLEGMQSQVPQAQTASLVRQILDLSADMPDADVLARTEAGESFSSPSAALKLADALGAFSERVANNPRVVAALVQFNQDAADARPAAALLVDRISAHTLTQAQEAGGANFGLQAVQRLYGGAWTTTLGQVPPAERNTLGESALLVQRLVSNERIDGQFLNRIATNLANRPNLERGTGGARGVGMFNHYFGVSSSKFGESANLAKIEPGAVRDLLNYTTRPFTVTLNGSAEVRALRDHVDRLVATLDQDGWAEQADALLRALPDVKPMKAHFERLIQDLIATVDDSISNPRNVKVASRRLKALCELGGRSPVIDQHFNALRAAETSQSFVSRIGNLVTFSKPAGLGTFPPDADRADGYRRWALSEIKILNRSAPDLMRIATGVMLEQFANSAYTDFGAFQKALVGGDGIDGAVTDGLKQNLADRLQIVGLGNVSGATGATAGDNQIVSLLRLSLFAHPTAEAFMAQAAEGLRETGESVQEATGALRDQLETYTNAGSLMSQQVRSLMPGQTLEIELTTSGSLRIKAPVAAPGVNATAGFSASRANSLTVTREGNGYIVVCKTGLSGGLSAGISALAGRASASVNAGGNVAAGAVLEFDEGRMREAGALRQPIDRVGELLTQLLSASGAQDPAAALRNSIPDRMHLLDSRGAYVGAEVGANANAKLPGPLAAASLTLEVNAAAGAEVLHTNHANSFEHRRTAQTSYSLAAQASAAVGTQDNQTGASISSSITMRQEKTMVATHGVVTTESFTRTTALIENALNGGRSNGDFDRMMDAIGISPEVRTQYEAQLLLMQRQGPISIALRQQLAPEAALRLATLGPQESAGTILNNPANYMLTALEFTVTGQVSRTAPPPEPETEAAEEGAATQGAGPSADDSDSNDLVAQAQRSVGNAQANLGVAREALADPRGALKEAADDRLNQVREGLAPLRQGLEGAQRVPSPEIGTSTLGAARLVNRGEDVAQQAANAVQTGGEQLLNWAEAEGVTGFAQRAAALLAAGFEEISGVLEEVAGVGFSVSVDRTETARSTRVFALHLAPATDLRPHI